MSKTIIIWRNFICWNLTNWFFCVFFSFHKYRVTWWCWWLCAMCSEVAAVVVEVSRNLVITIPAVVAVEAVAADSVVDVAVEVEVVAVASIIVEEVDVAASAVAITVLVVKEIRASVAVVEAAVEIKVLIHPVDHKTKRSNSMIRYNCHQYPESH